MYWEAKTSKLFGLNASGRSPYALSREVFQEMGLNEIPENGPLSWSVPGCVSGWDELRRKFGNKPLAELVAPAIDQAEAGFALTPVIAKSWQEAESDLQCWPDSAATYLPGGRAPRWGETFRNPRLAASYRLIAEHGPDAFYRGPIAVTIVDFSRANGGYFELRDFADHQSDWVQPLTTVYRGYEVWELPPNGQGIAVLEMLNLLEGYDLAVLGPGDPEYLHLLVEAKKVAFADRARFYADPAFYDVPVAVLISKRYADRRRKLIDPNRAATNIPPGDPQLARLIFTAIRFT